MQPKLPPAFVADVSRILGADADAFLRSYAEPRTYGLRLNPLKLPDGHPVRDRLTRLFGLRPVSWCSDGYGYDPDTRPGRHPFHAAGLYYIQEPSAMIAAALLGLRPGETVLDLAAAPGGKTTQLAAAMRGEGLLVANEIHPARARILSENVERMGIRNALVTQATPQELSARFPGTFDRILLDAPCSGEGMFRKDPDAVAEWSPQAVAACAARQRDILPHAADMLKPGGVLVYSTCTFNEAENEETIADFLSRRPDFACRKMERLWPHRIQGEGHFAALLVKQDGGDIAERPGSRSAGRPPKGRRQPNTEAEALRAYEAFAGVALPGFRLPPDGAAVLFGEALFWLPQPAGGSIRAESLRGLRVLRAGLHLGDCRPGGRFEPNHALALAADASAAAQTVDFAAEAAETIAYLKGETLPAPAPIKGWGLATVEGFPLGWFKASDGWLKNRLPKGLRWQHA